MTCLSNKDTSSIICNNSVLELFPVTVTKSDNDEFDTDQGFW